MSELLDKYDALATREKLWALGLLKWKLWPQQIGIYELIRNLPNAIQEAVILCARQYGKSFLGTLLALEDCIRNPGCSVLIVGPTIKQTTDIVNQAMRNITFDAPEGLVKRSKSESRWFIGDSELLIGGFDVKNASRQRGKSLYRIYIEEIVDAKADDYEEALRSDLGPALTHSENALMTFLTTLPRVPDHPFITKTMPKAKLNNAFFSFTIRENKQLTEEKYKACVDRCGGEDTLEFKREYLNQIVRDPTILVIPHFNEPIHVVNFNPPHYCKWQVAVDWGGVRDMTAAILYTYDYENNKDLIWKEMVWGPNTPTDEIVADLKEWEIGASVKKIYQRIVDAPGQVQVDLITMHNYEIRPPHKEDWLAGVNQMATRFSLKQINIHPDCKFIIESCRSGTFNKQKTDFERTSALGHCDGLAALMYGLRGSDRTSPYPDFEIPFGVKLRDDVADYDMAKKMQPKSIANTFESNQYKAKRFGRFKG